LSWHGYNPLMKRSAVVLVQLAALLCLASCGGQRPAVQESAGQAAAQRPALPAFPPADAPAPAARQASADSLVLDGSVYAELSPGSDSYVAPADAAALALVPAGGESLAWARYAVSGITMGKPITASVDLSEAKATPGGVALPLRCWIAVADYTQAYWEWHGPYTEAGAADITLNAPADGETPARADRYVSAAGTLQLLVLTDAAEVAPGPGNLNGLCAARIASVTVITSLTYQANKPHYAYIESLSIGSDAKTAAALKAGSSLQPSQFIYLDWTHVQSLGPLDLVNTASGYLVYRQGPADLEPLQIGSVVQPAFTDPLDRAGGTDEPVAGVQYYYFLRAQNTAGQTPLARSAPVVIPMLPPDTVGATLDDPSGFQRVNWSEADGAQAYEVWRADTLDSAQAVQLARVGAFPLTYLDNLAVPARVYWYFVKSEGLGDGNAGNGLEPGALSGFSLGAQGLRGAEITVQCTTGGVSGQGTLSLPYELLAGNSYQFAAYDQLGTELTADATWAVEPPERGSFSATTPGLLEYVAAGPAGFRIVVTYSVLVYTWSGFAECEVW